MNKKELNARKPLLFIFAIAAFTLKDGALGLNNTPIWWQTIFIFIFIFWRIFSEYYIHISNIWRWYIFLTVPYAILWRFYPVNDNILYYIGLYAATVTFVCFLRKPNQNDDPKILINIICIFLAASNKSIYLIPNFKIYFLIATSVIILYCVHSVKSSIKLSILRYLIFFITLGTSLATMALLKSNEGKISSWLLKMNRFSSGFSFDESTIGGLEKNWNNNKSQNKVMLRVKSNTAPNHLKATSFDRYINGKWKNSFKKEVHVPRLYGKKDALIRIKKSEKPQINQKEDFDITLIGEISKNVFTTIDTNWVRIRDKKIKVFKNMDIESLAYAGRDGYQLYTNGIGIQRILPKDELQKYMEKPEGLSEDDQTYLQELSNKIMPKSNELNECILAIRKYLIKNHKYSLNPKIDSKNMDPIMAFLKQKENAHCQYFASAMIFLLREYKIPARYTTGYLCYKRNPFGNYWIAQKIDAHAWVEYYDNGWKTLDPTEGLLITDETKKILEGFSQYQDYFEFLIIKLYRNLIHGIFKENVYEIWDIFTDYLIEYLIEVYITTGLILIFGSYIVIKRKNKSTNMRTKNFFLEYTLNGEKKKMNHNFQKIEMELKKQNIDRTQATTLIEYMELVKKSKLDSDEKEKYLISLEKYSNNRYITEPNAK